MAYIYYISRIKQTNRGGYVGQDIGDIFNENNRIVQHAKIAYGLSSKKLYGSEILMRQNSLSGLYYRIYDSESDCFGVGQEAFEEFSRFWEHSKGGVAAKLDFAELCHIFIGNFESSFANANLRIGGQNIWTFKQEGLLVLAEQVDDLKRKKSPLSYVELLGRNNGELGKLTIHFPDGIAEGVKVFEPQGYIIARLIANGVTEHFLSDSDS